MDLDGLAEGPGMLQCLLILQHVLPAGEQGLALRCLAFTPYFRALPALMGEGREWLGGDSTTQHAPEGRSLGTAALPDPSAARR